jgi:N-acetylglucosaminyldiphosphoundecaprenol N-acetyl-beta-D-mannosaminyltransferase
MTAHRQRLMGMPLDAVTYDAAVQILDDGLTVGRGGAVLTPNLDILRQYRRSEAITAAFETIELLVADGVPIVWASRIQGTPLPARITGTDMLWGATAVAARHDGLLFLAGGRPDVGPRTAEKLQAAYRGLRVVSHPCFVSPGTLHRQIEELADVLCDAAPEVVLIALPFVAQLHLMMTLRARLPRAWSIGVGSSFDFITEDRTRAPVWLQRLGLEWAHRVVHEPRVARRYLVNGLPFAARLGACVLGTRLRQTAGGLVDPGREPRLR